MKTKVFSNYHPEWIESFAQMRQECKNQLTKAENVSKIPCKTIKGVQKPQKQKCNRLFGVLRKMKDQCMATKKMEQKCTISVNGDQIGAATVNAETDSVTVSADLVNEMHSYAKKSGKYVPFKYECGNCKYKTDKKSNYDDHIAGCGRELVKNMECPICAKHFIYRSLRQHLNHFSTGKHIPTDQSHSKYTPKDHQQILEYLKQLKKTKQI